MAISYKPTQYYIRNIYEDTTILDFWEKSVAHGDSITPSVFYEAYREFILYIITQNHSLRSKILSIGSGNGFTEAAMAQHGHDVICIDSSPKSVELCKKKGLDSFLNDFFSLPAHQIKPIDIIYMDGVLGHLIKDAQSAKTVTNALAIMLNKSKTLLISNDATSTPLDIEKHKDVDEYYLLHDRFVQSIIESLGFSLIKRYTYEYARPISGARTRIVYFCCFS